MPTSYTTLLGLALPVTGELAGVWGDVVSNYITQYLDSAVAGTQTISGSQTAVTLSVTNGSSLVTAGSGATGSAQFQIINCTGNPAGLLTITAPASSRQYIIINATSTSQSVKIVGTGPTTGVTLISGEKAHVAWNGSDFVKIATTAAAGGSNTQVQYNSSGVLAGSSNLTFDGTNLTVGGTASATKLIPTGGAITGNGMYLPAANSVAITTNGAQAIYIDSSQNVGVGVTPSAWYVGSGTSKAIQFNASSALYDFSASGNRQTQLLNNAYLNTSANFIYLNTDAASRYMQNAGIHSWYTAGSGTAGTAISFTQAMTLDASGNLGIGTSSPGAKVHVYDTSHSKVLSQTTTGYAQFQASSTSGDFHIAIDNSTGAGFGAGAYSRLLYSTGAYPMVFFTNATERMRLDSSGNLGLGVTPSAWDSSVLTALQVRSGSISSVPGGGNDTYVASNAYYNVSWKYIAAASAPATYYRQANGTHSWNTAASGTAGNAISFTQAMTLTAGGDLGVGTTSPGARLHVAGEQLVQPTTAANAKLSMRHGSIGNNNYFEVDSSSNTIFGTINAERARITGGGNLLIGATATFGAGILQAQSATAGQLSLRHSSASSGKYWNVGPDSSGSNFVVYNQSSAGVYLLDGGTSWTSSSDERIKDIIEPITDAANKVSTLRAVIGKYKNDEEGTRRAFLIAQDVQSVLPEAVNVRDDEIGTLGLQYTDVIPLLVAAIKEQQALIEQLTSRIAALESKGA